MKPKNNTLLGDEKIIILVVTCLMILLQIISIFALIYGVSMFWRGFHNIDLGANYFITADIFAKYNITIGDVGSNDKFYTHVEMYSIGIDQLLYSFPILIFSSMMLGISLMMTTFIKNHKNKEELKRKREHGKLIIRNNKRCY